MGKRLGARQTLRDPDLRSVLIEPGRESSARNDRIVAALAARGFMLTRRGDEAADVVNRIFSRRAAADTAAGVTPVAGGR